MRCSTTPSRGRVARLMGLALASLAAVVVLGFHPAEAQAQTASVRVQTIHATNNGDVMDGALSSIASQLRSRFRQYSSFRQQGDTRLNLAQGQSRSVSLPSGQDVTVRFDGMSGSAYRLVVSMRGGSTSLTVSGGGVIFVSGPNYQGGQLVIALSI